MCGHLFVVNESFLLLINDSKLNILGFGLLSSAISLYFSFLFLLHLTFSSKP